MPAFGLHAQLERHAAQHESHQHRRDRQIERAEDLAVRAWKRHQQQPDAEHEPGLVRVPVRRDGPDHDLLLLSLRRRHQHSHAEVVAVEEHVREDREGHQRREDEHEVHQLFLAMCVSVTMYAANRAVYVST